MKKEVNDFINNTYQIFRDKEEFDMIISQVLSLKNEDGIIGFQAIAVSQNDPDEIRCVCENIHGKFEYQKIPCRNGIITSKIICLMTLKMVLK